MSLEQEIRTFSGYGYNLGGPRGWNLFRFAAGDELRTAWYDETDPTHYDFPARARQALSTRLSAPAGGGDRELPVLFMEALEVSPPGWRRETGASPSSSYSLPPNSELRSLDRIAVAQFVIIHANSLFDRDAEDLAHHQGEEYGVDPAIGGVGHWDRDLLDALAGLDLAPVGMPESLWFRAGWTEDDDWA